MNEIIREYSSGLFELASEEKCEAEVLEHARCVKKLFTREYVHMLVDPSIPKVDRVGLISEAFGGRINPYLLNFMKLMTERGLASDIKECFNEYEKLYYEKFGIVKVKAESAFPLSDEQKKKLAEKLEKNTGKRVELEYVVNPALIGGMRLDFGNRQIDDSVKTKLAEIGAKLADAVL